MKTRLRIQRAPDSQRVVPGHSGGPFRTHESVDNHPDSPGDHAELRTFPEHSTSRSLRQAAIIQAQQTQGNASVQRMLAQRSGIGIAQRKGGDPLTFQCQTFAGDTKLEAVLNDEDRLREGDSGDPVSKVQQALNSQSQTEGDASFAVDPDGKYGPKTAKAVRSFKSAHNLGSTSFGDVGPGTMRELDRLCPGGQGPKPGPKPGPNPNPIPTPVEDRKLEDLLDTVILQHQILLKTQDDGLSRLESDLSKEEVPTDLGVTVLKAIGKAALGGVFSPLGDILKSGLKEANMSDDDQKTVNDNGISPILDALKDAVKDKMDSKVDEVFDRGGEPLETFIDSQRSLLTDASADVQEKFLTVTRPALRQPIARATVTGEDPRLERARKYADGLKKKRTNAFDLQYQESMSKYAVGKAQSKLKTTTNPSSGEEGTDLSKKSFDEHAKGNIDNVPGILLLNIDGDTPDKPVKVESASINGLSEKTRKRITKQDPSLLSLGFPMVARGKVNPGFSPLKLKLFNSSITIGRNEQGQPFEIDSTSGGKDWLKAKALHQKNILPPDVPFTVDETKGADETFNEIELKTLKQLNVELKGP